MNLVVIAPYWSDNDIRMSGVVSYALFETSHPDPDVSARISIVNDFVTNQTITVFNAIRMLLVEWTGCQPFPAGANPVPPLSDPNYLASVSFRWLVCVYTCTVNVKTPYMSLTINIAKLYICIYSLAIIIVNDI